MPSVAVLLASFNGQTYLSEQIATIYGQVGVNVELFVSDDGSTDSTLTLLDQLAEKYAFTGNISRGPTKGFAENFRALILDNRVDADYVAFSDQDDVWDDRKLAVAIEQLKKVPAATPALYCSRTLSVSADLKPMRLSPNFKRTPSFRNALVQSLAGANTMVMNRAAFELVRKASRRTSFVSHDWWCYQLVSGAGGAIFYDRISRIRYRQHPNNQVGSNTGWFARVRRMRFLFAGGFAAWNQRNIDSLLACHDLLSPDAQTVVSNFNHARSGRSFLARSRYLKKSAVYRQTLLGTLLLYFACITGKM